LFEFEDIPGPDTPEKEIVRALVATFDLMRLTLLDVDLRFVASGAPGQMLDAGAGGDVETLVDSEGHGEHENPGVDLTQVLERGRSADAGSELAAILSADGKQIVTFLELARHAQKENELVLVEVLLVLFMFRGFPRCGLGLLSGCRDGD